MKALATITRNEPSRRLEPEQALQERAYRLPEHWIWGRDDRDWHEALSRCLSVLIQSRLPGGRILDVGCGDGKGTNDVQSALGSSYVLAGTDYSSRAIAFARLMAPHICFWVSRVGDGARVDVPYDGIIFREVIEHLPSGEEEPALRQLYEGLRPGGLLFLTTPHAAVPVSDKHFRHYTVESLARILHRTGFVDLAFFGFGRLPPRGLRKVYRWAVVNAPLLWRVCRRMNVMTRPTRCRTLVCVAWREEHALAR